MPNTTAPALDPTGKLDPAILRGVDKYILITNVPGTAHPEVGSIDKLQALLSEKVPIPSEVWWRNDINRRLDSAWDLKWAYPEIMVGPDLLRVLIEFGMQEDQERRATTIRAFLSDQYGAVEEVKFKQVELQNRLVDLFVDVPASPLQSRAETARPRAALAYFFVALAKGNFLRLSIELRCCLVKGPSTILHTRVSLLLCSFRTGYLLSIPGQ